MYPFLDGVEYSDGLDFVTDGDEDVIVWHYFYADEVAKIPDVVGNVLFDNIITDRTSDDDVNDQVDEMLADILETGSASDGHYSYKFVLHVERDED